MCDGNFCVFCSDFRNRIRIFCNVGKFDRYTTDFYLWILKCFTLIMCWCKCDFYINVGNVWDSFVFLDFSKFFGIIVIAFHPQWEGPCNYFGTSLSVATIVTLRLQNIGVSNPWERQKVVNEIPQTEKEFHKIILQNFYKDITKSACNRHPNGM